MAKTTMFLIALTAWTAGAGVAVSAQHPGPLEAWIEREAPRLAASRLSAVRTAQSSDWPAVRQLGNRTRVRVVTGDGRTIKGRTVGASEERLVIVDGQNREHTLLRENVREVRLDRRVSVAASLGLGLLAGALAGNMAGRQVDICDSCDPPIPPSLAYAFHGGLVGGGVGLAIGHALRQRPGRLVYAGSKPFSPSPSAAPPPQSTRPPPSSPGAARTARAPVPGTR
jgi:hypothetical protein